MINYRLLLSVLLSVLLISCEEKSVDTENISNTLGKSYQSNISDTQTRLVTYTPYGSFSGVLYITYKDSLGYYPTVMAILPWSKSVTFTYDSSQPQEADFEVNGSGGKLGETLYMKLSMFGGAISQNAYFTADSNGNVLGGVQLNW